jgi:hypothetical protein
MAARSSARPASVTSARALEYTYLGTEHLLLALTGEADGVAARTAVERMVERGTGFAG